MIYWTEGVHTPLLAVVLRSAGIYASTIFVSYLPIAIASVLALAGMGGFAWYALIS